jgi:hypothetical protein
MTVARLVTGRFVFIVSVVPFHDMRGARCVAAELRRTTLN